MSYNSDAKILELIKEVKYFNYKRKRYIMLNYPEKAKVFATRNASNINDIENID